ncbi:MAG: SPOR domain-containing protein, partial [Hasllibacter sp.]
PMRERPEDPGGRIVAHQGLAVNAVSGGEGAGPVPSSVILAPPPEAPHAEDVARAAPAPSAAPRAEVIEVAMNGDDAAVAALASDLALDPAVGEALLQAAIADVIPADIPGVTLSPRPERRPARTTRRAVPVAAEVPAESVAAGALLAQIGTFADEGAARAEWDRLAAAHPGHLAGRDRVVQRRETGGRSWVRLRAAGFDGRPEAVRFCDAMLAAGIECVPVEAR